MELILQFIVFLYAIATPSEISRNTQKFEKQFPFYSSLFSEFNTSVPASKEQKLFGAIFI